MVVDINYMSIYHSRKLKRDIFNLFTLRKRSSHTFPGTVEIYETYQCSITKEVEVNRITYFPEGVLN